MATRGRGGIDQMDLGGDVDYHELERRQGEMATARGYGKPEVGIAHRTDISYDKDSSVFREWKDQSLWAGLPDVDKVYYNPNIDDHTLWRPRCDIFEEEQGRLRVEFELPGVPREDIHLSIKDNLLTLSALKPQTRREEGGFYHQTERHFGRFYRRILLPYNVDADNVKAHMDGGVLKVHLYIRGRVRIEEEGYPALQTDADTTAGAQT